jgi:cobalt-zinc-cadmium efflux system outer membrane protein
MITRILTTVWLISSAVFATAQSGFEAVLSEIEKNNKSIASERQRHETQKLYYRTGLNPVNPKVEYEYLPGRPDGAGTQQDLAITQAFDFPTAYGGKRQVSQQQILQSELESTAFRQEVLLEAKVYCIQFVYQSDLLGELKKRLTAADQLADAMNRKTQQGESNILDLNKARLLQVDLKNQVALTTTNLAAIQTKLGELNGGTTPDLSSVTYPMLTDLPGFEELDSLIEANDPVVRSVRQQREVNIRQIKLTKALALPKVDAGYHRQSILGQTYEGVHFALTVPLWEDKNRVKTEQARLQQSELEIQEHRTSHVSENRQLYDQYLHWLTTVEEYSQILDGGNNEELLNRALQAGQISVIEYLMEMRYFYDAVNVKLGAEMNLHEAVATLYKFQL